MQALNMMPIHLLLLLLLLLLMFLLLQQLQTKTKTTLPTAMASNPCAQHAALGESQH